MVKCEILMKAHSLSAKVLESSANGYLRKDAQENEHKRETAESIGIPCRPLQSVRTGGVSRTEAR